MKYFIGTIALLLAVTSFNFVQATEMSTSKQNNIAVRAYVAEQEKASLEQKKPAKKKVSKPKKAKKPAAKKTKKPTTKKTAKKAAPKEAEISTTSEQVSTADLTLNDPKKEELPPPLEEKPSGKGKGLTIAGLSGLSGLGLVALLRKMFWH